MGCCCCCGSPNQTHIALTINTGILFILFLIMACVMVSSTNDYKIVKAYIGTYENFDFSNWSNQYPRRLDLICTYEMENVKKKIMRITVKISFFIIKIVVRNILYHVT